MDIQVDVNNWLKLPIDTRVKLREIFNIPKSKGVILEDNVVKSDGTTYEDLQAISLVALRKHTGIEDGEFVPLFTAVVAQIEEDKELDVEPEVDTKQIIVNDWISSLLKLKAQAQQMGMEDYLLSAIKQTFNLIKKPNAEPTKPRTRGRKTKPSNA